MPSQSRMIRPIDEKFAESLIDEMTRMPEGNYEALFILCKDCESKADFDTAKLHSYTYEVIGGAHNTTAAKKLNIQFPENPHYRFRYARIYVGSNDEEALWLGTRHNLTGEFRHSITFLEEVFNQGLNVIMAVKFIIPSTAFVSNCNSYTTKANKF